MKRSHLACLCLACFWLWPLSSQAQHTYDTTWSSLDARPVPEWFRDAKLGIFIHWGLYSVPAWAPVGTYAEWYQYYLRTKTCWGNSHPAPAAVYDHHVKTFGSNFHYAQFANRFRAEDFNPDAWARLFEKAGARYVVLTSKHHDGFCLWPSPQASRDFSRPWNSMVTAAHQDLVGELAAAIRKTPIKFGLYYSLFEWFDPLWMHKSTRSTYVTQHMIPQLKDLVNRYHPSVLWADGDWDMSDTGWHSRQFLQWLYNDSPVKDSVAVNDRWGSGDPHKHGGYYSTEYTEGVAFHHPWEECRGIGYSFGLNLNENVQDYNSARTLVLLLSDIVSHGGNLLLDIGPEASGQIPAIMQERLLQLGSWLHINGEAIYGSRSWIRPVQWSAGTRISGQQYKKKHHLNYLGGDFILKQTLNPDPGMAVKEVFFTRKGSTLYAILPAWPNHELRIRDLQLQKSSRIQVLGSGQRISWTRRGSDTLIHPGHLDRKGTSRYAYVLRITDVKDKAAR